MLNETMATISVALICKNEEKRLPRWLEAVSAFADEVVAVDSGSGDASLDILRAAGARVEQRGWSGYSDQRNHAASLCSGDWIFCLDADEVVDQDLAASLNQLKSGPQPREAGFEILYKVFFFGRFLRHGGFFPEKHLRLHRREAGRWVRSQVHERLEVDGAVGRLQEGYVEHYSYDTVGDYLRRMEIYSENAARHMHQQGRRTSGAGAWGHAAWAFAYRYLIRLGFLDGFEGYLAARLESLYTLGKYARLRELGREGGGR